MIEYLTDNVDAWLAWYGDSKPQKQRWGTAEDTHMLQRVTGQTSITKQAIKDYQKSKGLTDDGILGPKSRKQLITDYMAADGTSLPSGTTVIAHGCGESFPVVQSGDGKNEQENRRVELFVFEKEIDPAPSGEISKPGSGDYAAWNERVVETIELGAARRTPLDTRFALDVLDHVTQQLSGDGFVHFIHTLFGSDVTVDAVRALSNDVPNLLHPPTFVVSELPGDRLAAYDGTQRCILIHQRVLDAIERGEAKGWMLAGLLLEEYGHHIDTLLRQDYSNVGGDAEGDEGRLFAITMLRVHWEEIPTSQVALWRTREITLDWNVLRQELKPADLASTADAQAGGMEFHGGDNTRSGVDVEIGDNQANLSNYAPGAVYPSFAAFAQDSAEAQRIEAYFSMLHTMKIHGLVEVARKLDKRLAGQPSGFFATPESGPLDIRARLTVLHTLHRIYRLLDKRFAAAPIGANGLPDFSDAELGPRTSNNTVIFTPGSPLAGIVEDVAPFGSVDGWVIELNTTRLPAIPQKPTSTDDELDWGDPAPAPTPPTLDPERDAGDAMIDVGDAQRRTDQVITDNASPDREAANRNTTIVDAVWGLAGELSPAAEALGPVGAIVINVVSLYNTLVGVDDSAKQNATMLGLEAGAEAILNAASFHHSSLAAGSAMNASIIVGYIRLLPNGDLKNRWNSRAVRPAAEIRGASADAAIDKLASVLRTALVRTEGQAQLVPGYLDASAHTQQEYLARVGLRVHVEFARAVMSVVRQVGTAR